jgi:bifunctional DNA primase/polymerase-like protein/primase-like protein
MPDRTLAFAQAYHKAGLSIFPLDPRSKRPLGAEQERPMSWSAFQKQRIHPNHLEGWFGKPLYDGSVPNLAIVCGAVSGNLAVLDFDNGDVWAKFFSLFPDVIERTKVAATGKGYHVYVKLPEPIAKGYALGKDGKRLGLDLQGEGSYVVAPPSIHPDGARYQWINPEQRRIGRYTSTEVLALAERLGGTWTTDERQKRRYAHRTSPQGHSPGPQPNWISSTLLAGQRFHDGDGRNSELTKLMGFFRNHLPIDIGYAIAYLWAKSCSDPLEDSEIETIVNSVYRYGSPEPEAEQEAEELVDLEV